MSGWKGRALGFTIIELMVVIGIIGLLAGIAVPTYIYTHRRAKESRLRHDLRVMRDLIQQYKVDRKVYPESLEDLKPRYLRVIPEDVMTGQADWTEIHNEPEDPEDLNADTGIVDVQSTAPGSDSDGKAFAEY